MIDQYGGWQAAVLGILAGLYDAATSSFPSDTMQKVGRLSFCWCDV